jgi:hypothetical protein
MDQQQIDKATTFLTTEHFVLQGLRSGTIMEANGRVSNYMTVVSSALVALAFVAQLSEGKFFVQFGLAILPIVVYVGFTTFVRLIQLRMADFLYVQATNRLRRFYLDVAPDAAPYLSASAFDDIRGIVYSASGIKNLEFKPGSMRFQRLITSSGQVEVVNSFLVGVFAALLAQFFELPGALTAVIAVMSGLIAYYLHYAYDTRVVRAVNAQMEFRFPTPAPEDTKAE